MKLIHAQIAEAQRNYDAAKRKLTNAVVNAGIGDEEVLELRASARELLQILSELDGKMLRGWR